MPADLQLNPPASPEQICTAESHLAIEFQQEFRESYLRANGFTGFCGVRYVEFWAIESLAAHNRDYSCLRLCPRLILIGRDDGQFLFATSRTSPGSSFWQIDSFRMADSVKPIATSIAELIDWISAGQILPAPAAGNFNGVALDTQNLNLDRRGTMAGEKVIHLRYQRVKNGVYQIHWAGAADAAGVRAGLYAALVEAYRLTGKFHLAFIDSLGQSAAIPMPVAHLLGPEWARWREIPDQSGRNLFVHLSGLGGEAGTRCSERTRLSQLRLSLLMSRNIWSYEEIIHIAMEAPDPRAVFTGTLSAAAGLEYQANWLFLRILQMAHAFEHTIRPVRPGRWIWKNVRHYLLTGSTGEEPQDIRVFLAPRTLNEAQRYWRDDVRLASEAQTRMVVLGADLAPLRDTIQAALPPGGRVVLLPFTIDELDAAIEERLTLSADFREGNLEVGE